MRCETDVFIIQKSKALEPSDSTLPQRTKQASIIISLNTPGLQSIETHYCFHTFHSNERLESRYPENEAAQQKHSRQPSDVGSSYFPAAGNVLTADSTERNASSPLLRLPPELRNRIYELGLGGQTIHITENFARGPCERLALLHYLCNEPESEENNQIAFDSSDAAWNAPATSIRHEKCYGGWSGGLERSLLQSCRQIYNEANIVRYYSNTFSFQADVPACLKLFCRQVPARYRNAIRRLHLNIDIRDGAHLYESQQCAEMFRTLSHHLKGIQKFYLTINLVQSFHGYDMFLYQPPSESQIVRSMLQETKMNLKVATVTIGEDTSDAWGNPGMRDDHLWTMAQKKEWSQYLRGALLSRGNLDTGVAEEEA